MTWPLAVAVRMRRRGVRVPGASVVVFVLSVLALLRFDVAKARFGWGLGVSVPVWVRRAREEEATVDENVAQKSAEDRNRMIGFVSGAENVSRALERAGSGEGAVGPATVVGDRTVIPLIETFAAGGFGGGSGSGTDTGGNEGSGAGGGGGGIGRSRTMAIADVGPEGVKIRPVLDVTGLALPAVSAVAALLLGRRRRLRRR